jgi:hypothetical protein
LNATESRKLDDYVKKSHPEAKGSNPALSPMVANVYMWLGKNLPFLRNAMGYTEFKAAHFEREDILRYDNSQSKAVLGLGSYRSVDNTCRDAANSIKPFIEVVA